MTYELAILVTLWAGLTLYTLLGGADFGGGVWTLLASGPTRKRQHQAVAKAIGPVWEANHVWLIFVITGLFAAFPRAFEVLSVSLYVPFSIALAGIVFRGAAFAFRAHGDAGGGWQGSWTKVFGVASLVTPLVLGASAGAIASGTIRINGDSITSGAKVWTGPLPVLCGLLALAVCAHLAASYLCFECAESGDRELEDIFRERMLASGGLAGLLALGGLAITRSAAPVLWKGMLHHGLAFIAASGVAGLASLGAAASRRYRAGRLLAAVAVAAVLAGWGAAQWPLLIVPDLTVAAAAAPPAEMKAIAVGMIAGGVLLVPSLAVLFRVFKASRSGEGPQGALDG